MNKLTGKVAVVSVRPMIETFGLERVGDAYEHIRSGRVRLRSVLKV
jgi:D-arabinose 1-dehydrogenase-like Zn-dependent alcohol dehydrogenase